MVGIAWDITKKRELEKQHREILKENEQLMDIYIENIPLGIWTAGPNGQIDYQNKYIKNNVKLTLDELNNGGKLSTIHPDDRSDTTKRWEEAMRTGNNFEIEYRLKIGEEYRWFIGRAYPLKNPDGNIIRWFGTIVDIHDLKTTITELEFQINLTKTITDNTTSGLFMMNEKGHPNFMNPAAERISGYRLDEIKEKPLHNSVHYKYPDGSPFPMEECLLSVELKPMRNQHEVFVDKNGRLFPVILSVSPLSKNGKIIGAVIEFRDVTLERQVEQDKLDALREAELLQKKRAEDAENNKQRQDEFINTICHEVRNPLNGLIGSTSLLKDEVNDIYGHFSSSKVNLDQFFADRLGEFFPRVYEHIKTLEACGEQQKIIVDDVLDLSKLENNKVVLNDIPLSVKSLLDNILQIFLGKLAEKHLQYKTVVIYKDRHPPIISDHHQLTIECNQVYRNRRHHH